MNSEYRETLWLMRTGINAVTEYYAVSLPAQSGCCQLSTLAYSPKHPLQHHKRSTVTIKGRRRGYLMALSGFCSFTEDNPPPSSHISS
jgi:hypothetical protein